MTPKEELEQTYDFFASSYRACCKQSNEICLVLTGLNDLERLRILRAAKAGWIERLKFLDHRLAEQGEL
jgi:hypothetical protein